MQKPLYSPFAVGDKVLHSLRVLSMRVFLFLMTSEHV